MRAVVLSAGRGSRVGALTAATPKCLLPVAGRPLLDWQLAALRAAGVDDIAVVCGYRREALDGYPVTRFVNPRWSETGIAASLMCAADWLAADGGIIGYSDIVYSGAAVAGLRARADDIVVLYDPAWRRLWERRMPDPLADAEGFRLSPGGTIAAIGGRVRDIAEVEGQYIGLIKLSRAGWSQLAADYAALGAAEQAGIDMTGLLSRMLKRGRRLAAEPIRGGWMEIDTSADLVLCEAMVGRGELVLDSAHAV